MIPTISEGEKTFLGPFWVLLYSMMLEQHFTSDINVIIHLDHLNKIKAISIIIVVVHKV